MIKVITQFPIALDSPDHLYPHGTRENLSSGSFINSVVSYFQNKKINFLDLGCAGGQLVADFIPFCNCSIGLEGSDWNLKNHNSLWDKLHNTNLFTCDVSREFWILDDENKRVKFHCISAWEVVEHIQFSRLKQFFINVHNHLTDNGIFCCSISTNTEPAYHKQDGTSGPFYHSEFYDVGKATLKSGGYGKDTLIVLHQSVMTENEWDEYIANLDLFKFEGLKIHNRVRTCDGSFQRDFLKK